MEDQQCKARVKAVLRLGTESFFVQTGEGILSQQLLAMQVESMTILKNFITKNNIPKGIPDEAVESNSEEDETEKTVDNPPKKSKKQR